MSQIPVKLRKDIPAKDIDICRSLYEDAPKNEDGKISVNQVFPIFSKLGEDISKEDLDSMNAGKDFVSLAEILQCLLDVRKQGKSSSSSKPNFEIKKSEKKPEAAAPAAAAPSKSTPFGEKVVIRKPAEPKPVESHPQASTKFGDKVVKKSVPAYTAKTVEGESGAKHTYSVEEAVAFSNHINQCLKSDERLMDRLPLDLTDAGQSLFDGVRDGLLLCKLINKAVEDTVDERALNVKENMNIFQINENQNLVVNAAKAIGCKVVNIHNEDLIEGKPHLVLGLVWQIVRIQLLSQINLKNHPELVRLLEEGEELSDLLKLPADQLLLRWINFHLKNAGDPRRVSNFGADLQDSHVYTILLNQIDATKCDKRALNHSDPMDRATIVIENSVNLGVESFITPENIASGNARLNLAFCAQIFNTNPGFAEATKEEIDMAGMLDDENAEDTREERVFRMWLNSLGIEDMYVNHLFEDLRDGVVMLQVYDKVEPGVISWKQVNRPPKNKYKKMENCNYVVNVGKGKNFNFSLVNVGGVDIADGNKKLILSIVWQVMRMYSLKLLSSVTKDGSIAKDTDVVNWANAKVAGEHAHISSFKDKDLSDGQYFLALCNALKPGVVDPEIATKGETDEEKASNAKYVISVARKLGACVFLTWEDIVEVKSKMLLTFTASLMAWEADHPSAGGKRASSLGVPMGEAAIVAAVVADAQVGETVVREEEEEVEVAAAVEEAQEVEPQVIQEVEVQEEEAVQEVEEEHVQEEEAVHEEVALEEEVIHEEVVEEEPAVEEEAVAEHEEVAEQEELIQEEEVHEIAQEEQHSGEDDNDKNDEWAD